MTESLGRDHIGGLPDAAARPRVRLPRVNKETLWDAGKRADPNRSAAYIRRFEQLISEGADMHGEARCIDAMAPRNARILDAGCGPGRVGGSRKPEISAAPNDRG
ncbi:hypothetical protein GCM10027404_13770 [Arthrobacter tumbae]|nr:hypothetical protein [Arthrobacter tumbae]